MAAFNAPVERLISRSRTLPGFIMRTGQTSGAFNLLPDRKFKTGLISNTDLKIYAHTLEQHAQAYVNQFQANNFDNFSVNTGLIGTATYSVRTNASYTTDEMELASSYGGNLMEWMDKACLQAHFDQYRMLELYGFGKQGEGILNAIGITKTNLPADSGGNTTVSTQDPGQLVTYFNKKILDRRSAMYMYNSGVTGMRTCIMSTQKIIGHLESVATVQLTDAQREGAGSFTAGDRIKYMQGMVGNEVEYLIDDTLAGKGDGGADVILIVIPEMVTQGAQGYASEWNTNEFGTVAGGIKETLAAFSAFDMPRELTAPMGEASGIRQIVLKENRVTCGWVFRPEAVTVISAHYE